MINITEKPTHQAWVYKTGKTAYSDWLHIKQNFLVSIRSWCHHQQIRKLQRTCLIYNTAPDLVTQLGGVWHVRSKSDMSCTCFLFNPSITIVFTFTSRIWIRKFNSDSASQDRSNIMKSIDPFNFFLLYLLNLTQLDTCLEKLEDLMTEVIHINDTKMRQEQQTAIHTISNCLKKIIPCVAHRTDQHLTSSHLITHLRRWSLRRGCRKD